jgi:hypothetical protein
VNMHARNDEAFKNACRDGHLVVARWLVALDSAWVWPLNSLKVLQAWSRPRDAWMRGVLQ